jgi:hypothetical protein
VRLANGGERLLVVAACLPKTPLLLECAGELDENRGTIALSAELEGAPVGRLRRGQIESHRPVTGEDREPDQALLETVEVEPGTCGATQLERPRVVVREELRLVGQAPFGLPLDTLGCPNVLLRAGRGGIC